MSTVGEREIRTHRRVAAFFHDALGYVHLGDWQDRAGNETEGLRYGAIETPEKHWLRWKEAGASLCQQDNPAVLQQL